MNSPLPRLFALTFTLGAAAAALGQGALAPPGPPAPLFRTLDQIEPRTPIFKLPTNLTQSGSYYVTSNLTGVATSNGITILANDITIDLSGFTLTGVASSGDGIHVGATTTSIHTNLAVRNGTLRNWGGDGIDAQRLHSGSFLELRAIDNVGNGLNLGTNALVNLCIGDHNGVNGIAASSGTQIQNCTARANGQHGFQVIPPGSVPAATQIINCFAHTNGANGITVTRSMVVNCYSANNLGHGIDCGTRSTVSGCKVMLNPLDGIRAISGNLLIDNNIVGAGAVLGTTNACIASYGGSGNRFEGNHLANHDTAMIVTGGQCFIFKNTTQGCATNFVLTGSVTFGPTNATGGIATNHPWANFIE